MVEREVTPAPRARVSRSDLIHKKLRMAEYAEAPFMPDQELFFPDTVKIMKTDALVLDLSIPGDVVRYGDILESNRKRDAEIIKEQDRKYCERTGNWMVFLVIERRFFKTLNRKQELQLELEQAELERQEAETEEKEKENDHDS